MIEKWLAKTPEHISIAAFDFFSIGHIGMGVGFFIGLHLIYQFFYKKEVSEIKNFHLALMILISFALGVAWELWENVVMFNLGYKFEGRADSIANLTTDMIFVTLGSTGMAYLSSFFRDKKYSSKQHFITSILIFGVVVGLFFLGRHFTLF